MDCEIFRKNTFHKAMVILLNRPSLEFIGILSYGTKISLASPADYKLKVNIPSLAFTNGDEICLLSNDELSPKMLAAILFHEIWHILSYHPARCCGRDPVLWNMCVDHVTNRIIRQYSRSNILELPEGTVFFEDIHNEDPEITAEDLYLQMQEDWPNYKVETFEISGKGGSGQQQSGSGDQGDQDGQGQCPNCGSPMDGQDGEQGQQGQGQGDDQQNGSGGDQQDQQNGGGGGDQQDQQQSGGGGGKPQQNKCPNCGKEHDQGQGSQSGQGSAGNLEGKKFAKVTDTKSGKSWLVPLDCETKPGDEQKAKDASNKLAQQGKLIWNSNTVSKGDMPGEMVDTLDEIFKVEIPWDEVVEKAILYHANNMIRRGWQTRDPYIRSRVLPGRMTGVETECAIFVVDTSGSVSDKDLKRFLGICCDSANYFSKIAVFMHDHDLKQPEHWFDNRPDETEVYDSIRKVMGRGGTSHKEVFDRLEEVYQNELISVVCFLTDYESDVQHIHDKYEWIREIPTVWILNTNYNVELSEDYELKTIHIGRGE